MTDEPNPNLKLKSRVVTEGPDKAGGRAFLRGVGLNDDDFKKPFVGIASLSSNLTPCNMHLHRLADQAARGVRDANAVAFTFGTITVSDGVRKSGPIGRFCCTDFRVYPAKRSVTLTRPTVLRV